jgi:peptide/nickel transport system permease protein
MSEAVSGAARVPASTWRRTARLLLRGNFIIGGVLTLALIVVALLSFGWTPYEATKLSIVNRFKPPSAQYWLGTDHFGRDILSMIMVGARNSILVGFVAVSIGMSAGVALGALAAALRGWFDEILMRMADLTFAFPAVLLAIMITAIWGPGMVNAIIAIGIFNIPVFARLTRGAALGVWARDYVLAARAAGKGRFLITIEHVLPNVVGVLIVQGTIQFALAILAEAGLSYLGLGTQPPDPSWGRMLNDAQTHLNRAPWLAIFPGLAIALTVLGLNLLGDGLRDLLDPKLRRAR